MGSVVELLEDVLAFNLLMGLYCTTDFNLCGSIKVASH